MTQGTHLIEIDRIVLPGGEVTIERVRQAIQRALGVIHLPVEPIAAEIAHVVIRAAHGEPAVRGPKNRQPAVADAAGRSLGGNRER